MQIFSALDAIVEFMQAGGAVLSILLALSIFFWTLLLERFLYHKKSFVPQAKALKKKVQTL